MRRVLLLGAALTLAGAMAAGAAMAQMPADLAPKVREIGRVIDPGRTALIYGPLAQSEPYAGVKVTRDLAYGAAPAEQLSVFAPEQAARNRPVLIFVPGGQGNRREPVPMGEHFYDNIMLWAVKNGMIGVVMQRPGGQGAAWDSGARQIGQVIAWAKANAAANGGDPNRIFIWGHSAGSTALSVYLSHPEHWPNGDVGVKGAHLMAGGMNLAPLRVNTPPAQFAPGFGGGAAANRAPPTGGAPGAPPPARGAGQDPAVLLERSSLPGLLKLDLPLFLSAAEFDPEERPAYVELLKEQMCAVKRCPTTTIYKDHGHMSEVFAINTADVSTSKPFLDWMRSIR
jgi:triacylglycerol lipase